MPIVAFGVYAYGEALRTETRSRLWTKINAWLGLITLAVHLAFFMTGHAEFRQPASLLIFCAIALFSTLQIKPQ